MLDTPLSTVITRSGDRDAATEAYLELLDAVAESGLDASVSVKLTAFGLKLDRKVCDKNLRRVLERAATHDNFVRLDMEDSSCTDETLQIFDEIHELREHAEKPGVVTHQDRMPEAREGLVQLIRDEKQILG